MKGLIEWAVWKVLLEWPEEFDSKPTHIMPYVNKVFAKLETRNSKNWRPFALDKTCMTRSNPVFLCAYRNMHNKFDKDLERLKERRAEKIAFKA